MNCHFNKEELLENKELVNFIKLMPFDKIKKFYLLKNLILHITKRSSLSYIDIFGQSRNDTILDIIIEDKSNNISTPIDNIEFNY